MPEDQIDIHGTDWSQYQQVKRSELSTEDRCVVTLTFAQPLQPRDVLSLLDHLRSWHP